MKEAWQNGGKNTEHTLDEFQPSDKILAPYFNCNH
jgi:hypothetical protein